jgi:hypothetical protein
MLIDSLSISTCKGCSSIFYVFPFYYSRAVLLLTL